MLLLLVRSNVSDKVTALDVSIGGSKALRGSPSKGRTPLGPTMRADTPKRCCHTYTYGDIPREHGRFLLHYGEAKCRPCMIRLRSAQSAPAVVPAPMLGRVVRTAVTLADRPGWTKQSGAKRKKVGEQQPDSAAYRYYEFVHFGHNLSRRFATGWGSDTSSAGTSSAPYASLTVILHQEYSPVRARHYSRRYLLVRKTLLRPLSSPVMRLVVSPTPP